MTALQAASHTDQNSEDMKRVALRMKSLTQSLNGLPQPPAFDQKIQLPEIPPKKGSLSEEKTE